MIAGVVGVAVIALIWASHLSLLRLALATDRDAMRRIEDTMGRSAVQIRGGLEAAGTRAVACAGLPELRMALLGKTPGELARAETALRELLRADADTGAPPAARALLRRLPDGKTVVGLAMPQDAPAEDEAPWEFLPFPDQERGWRYGAARRPGDALRLALVADVPSPGPEEGELLVVFGSSIARLPGSLRPPSGRIEMAALVLPPDGVLAATDGIPEAGRLATVLEVRAGRMATLDVHPRAGTRRRLLGRWMPVDGTPLAFVFATEATNLAGLPPLVIVGSGLAGSALVCYLLLAFLRLARRHQRVAADYGRQLGADQSLQCRLSELERAQFRLGQLARAIGGAGEAVVMIDRQSLITYVNDTFESLFGFSREEVLDRSLAEFMPPDEALRVEPTVSQGTKTPVSLRLRCRHRGGARLYLAVTLSPVCREDGTVTHYLVTARDVQGEIELEERALQARKLAAVARLAGGTAHEFSNILQVILGYAGEMAEATQNPELREGLNQILAAGQRGSELTSRLIAFSRQQPSRREPTSLGEVIRARAGEIQRCLGSDSDLRLVLDCGTWQASLDSDWVGQALVHLAEAARDRMPGGGTLTLTADNVRLDQPTQTLIGVLPAGDYVRVRVEDTGQAIPVERLERLFEPVFDHHSEEAFAGLGLSMVHGAIAQHGGGVVVESSAGRGTTFEVYLPRCTDWPGEEAAETLASACRADREARVILLAEDEEPVRRVAATLLAKSGYDVIETPNGREAVEAVRTREGRIDLALLDIVMPEMNGADAAERIRRDYPRLPILFCSGYTKGQLDGSISLPDGIPLIGKPYEPRALLAKIAGLIAAEPPP